MEKSEAVRIGRERWIKKEKVRGCREKVGEGKREKEGWTEGGWEGWRREGGRGREAGILPLLHLLHFRQFLESNLIKVLHRSTFFSCSFLSFCLLEV